MRVFAAILIVCGAFVFCCGVVAGVVILTNIALGLVPMMGMPLWLLAVVFSGAAATAVGGRILSASKPQE